MATFLRHIVRRAVAVAQPARLFSSMGRVMVAKPSFSTSLFSAIRVPTVTPVREFHVKRKTNRRKLTKKYKLKSHRATAKRFTVTGTGRIMRWRAGKRHLARKKSKRQLRGLSKKVDIPKQLVRRYKRSLLL